MSHTNRYQLACCTVLDTQPGLTIVSLIARVVSIAFPILDLYPLQTNKLTKHGSVPQLPSQVQMGGANGHGATQGSPRLAKAGLPPGRPGFDARPERRSNLRDGVATECADKLCRIRHALIRKVQLTVLGWLCEEPRSLENRRRGEGGRVRANVKKSLRACTGAPVFS